MPKFRFHRGALAESMATVTTVADKEALCNIIRAAWGYPAFGDGQIEVSPYGYDNRIQWNTYVVTLDGKAIGFTDGPVEATP